MRAIAHRIQRRCGQGRFRTRTAATPKRIHRQPGGALAQLVSPEEVSWFFGEE